MDEFILQGLNLKHSSCFGLFLLKSLIFFIAVDYWGNKRAINATSFKMFLFEANILTAEPSSLFISKNLSVARYLR